MRPRKALELAPDDKAAKLRKAEVLVELGFERRSRGSGRGGARHRRGHPRRGAVQLAGPVGRREDQARRRAGRRRRRGAARGVDGGPTGRPPTSCSVRRWRCSRTTPRRAPNSRDRWRSMPGCWRRMGCSPRCTSGSGSGSTASSAGASTSRRSRRTPPSGCWWHRASFARERSTRRRRNSRRSRQEPRRQIVFALGRI